jgi:hypothetical protein
MSLNDILQIEKERILRERVVLKTVYERMRNRINNSVRVKSKECVYTIPEFIPGYPPINVIKTMEYLFNKLKTEGFIVIQISLTQLYITWDPVQIRELNERTIELESKKEQTNTYYEHIYNIPSEKKYENKKPMDRKIAEKEFERANEDFITTLVNSKRTSKN